MFSVFCCSQPFKLFEYASTLWIFDVRRRRVKANRGGFAMSLFERHVLRIVPQQGLDTAVNGLEFHMFSVFNFVRWHYPSQEENEAKSIIHLKKEIFSQNITRGSNYGRV